MMGNVHRVDKTTLALLVFIAVFGFFTWIDRRHQTTRSCREVEAIRHALERPLLLEVEGKPPVQIELIFPERLPSRKC